MGILQHNGDQQKLVSPEETVARVEALLHEAAPGVTLNLESVNSEIPSSYVASAFFDGISGSGKGLTPEQSRASALMECVERYSWLNFDYEGQEGYRYASYNELEAEGLPLPSPEYFFDNFIPNPITNSYLIDLLDVKMRWLPAKAILGDEIIYYPINYHSALYSSNGLAAGNDCQEACIQAICELFEREAIRRLYMDGRPGRLIDQSTITSPFAVAFLERAKEVGITFEILEVGKEYGVPVITARGHNLNHEGTLYEWGYGHGAHVNIELAINRALSEYSEGLASLLASEKRTKINTEFIKLNNNLQHMGFFNRFRVENYRWEGEPISTKAVVTPTLNTVEEQLAWLRERGAASGFKFYWYNLTHPQLKVPVVRVFAPFMGSVINTPVDNPASILAMIYYEGGKTKEAIRINMTGMQSDPMMKELFKNPMLSMMMPSILSMIPPEQIFQRNYQENLKQRGLIKQQGLGYVTNQLNSLSSVLKEQYKL